MHWNRIVGGILLVSGTTIGVGMLGLPVTTGFAGFFPSILLFFLTWAMMLLTGIYFVDINLSIEGETNLNTMAQRILGAWGNALSWVVYMLLLYSLMAAYIAASAPLFTKAFKALLEVEIPDWTSKFMLPLFFGAFIYLGTKGVDAINRLLMIALIAAYCILVFFLPEHIDLKLLTHIEWGPFIYAAPVVITAFGYHIIIPSLTTYLHHDRRSLLYCVIGGSLIALFVNLLWQFLVLGVVPLNGPNGLARAWYAGVPATVPLAKVVETPLVTMGAYLFAFFAIITSFLGVALSLSDFLMDGLKIKKSWEGRLLAILLTFIPPLVFVFSYERGFVLALEYAGAFVAILLVFLPSAMAWKLKKPTFYRSRTGRITLCATFGFSLFVIIVNLLIHWGFFDGMFLRISGV